jgi:hypothetical protein
VNVFEDDDCIYPECDEDADEEAAPAGPVYAVWSRPSKSFPWRERLVGTEDEAWGFYKTLFDEDLPGELAYGRIAAGPDKADVRYSQSAPRGTPRSNRRTRA